TLTVVYRMIVGPTILDRAVSTDSLLVLVVLGMALYTAHAKANWAGPAMLSMTGLAFIGTVTFARFVAREARPPGYRPSRDGEPGTGTARWTRSTSTTVTTTSGGPPTWSAPPPPPMPRRRGRS